MENSLTIALARQSVLARQMDVIATNLANLETAGFKSEHMIFTEHLEHADTLGKKFPNLPMVVDHISKPKIKIGRCGDLHSVCPP